MVKARAVMSSWSFALAGETIRPSRRRESGGILHNETGANQPSAHKASMTQDGLVYLSELPVGTMIHVSDGLREEYMHHLPSVYCPHWSYPVLYSWTAGRPYISPLKERNQQDHSSAKHYLPLTGSHGKYEASPAAFLGWHRRRFRYPEGPGS